MATTGTPSRPASRHAARLRTLMRRTVFLLLGSLLSAPYVAVVVWAAALYRVADLNPLAPLFGTGVAVGLFAVPAALRVTATLERTACDELLDTGLGAQPAPAALSDVLRSALWFGVHLATGFLVAVFLVVLFPATVALGLQALGWIPGDAPVVLEGVDPGTTAMVFSVGALASAVLIAVVVPQMPRWAVFLLGPSAGQRVALAEGEARATARRNRLARELHDSVGHALTVMILQAAAARTVLRSDPDAAEGSLAAVEETGRGAHEELDAALAVLRDPERADADPDGAGPQAGPQPGLEQVDALVDSFRAAGLDVEAAISPWARGREVPAHLSREAYRIAQEGLTNALRHGSAPRASVSVAPDGGCLLVRVENPSTAEKGQAPGGPAGARDAGDRPGGGRGLVGLRERIVLVGGRLEAGRRGETWILRGELPLGDADSRSRTALGNSAGERPW